MTATEKQYLKYNLKIMKFVFLAETSQLLIDLAKNGMQSTPSYYHINLHTI